MDKVLGIIGGMGPAATVDLMDKIIAATPAQCEEDHIRMLVDCNPKLPNRQSAILEGTKSPLPEMIAMAQGLERAGADFLILGANTPHYYFNDIQSAVGIPMLHIPNEAVAHILRCGGDVRAVGVLAANAPIRTGLFQQACEKAGLSAVVLPQPQQEIFHQSIFDFKVSGDKEAFARVVRQSMDKLIELGAGAIILGGRIPGRCAGGPKPDHRGTSGRLCEICLRARESFTPWDAWLHRS